MATHKLLLLPGDGIGPEVMAEVKRLVAWIDQTGLAKFETWPRLERVFEQGEVVIYATPGAVHAEKSWLDPVRYDAGLSPSPESAPGGE